jgi:hypothetical protein
MRESSIIWLFTSWPQFVITSDVSVCWSSICLVSVYSIETGTNIQMVTPDWEQHRYEMLQLDSLYRVQCTPR